MKEVAFLEVYITNTCNIACAGCNRFNNLNLKGHDDWAKHRLAYKNFADTVHVRGFVNVLGGEPLMHPKINDILTDLRDWYGPEMQIRLITNGLLIHKVKDFWKTVMDKRINLDISIHDKSWRIPIYEQLCKLAGKKLKLRWKIEHESQAAFVNVDGLNHRLCIFERFYTNILHDPTGKLSPYNSDPDKAFKSCHFNHFTHGFLTQSPTLFDGKLYKCPMGNSLPTAIRQRNDISYTQEQKDLIDSFHHIDCNDLQDVDDEYFMNFILNKIPQCALCPESKFDHGIPKQSISPNIFKST